MVHALHFSSRRAAFLETEQLEREEEHCHAEPRGGPGLSRAERADAAGAT